MGTDKNIKLHIVTDIKGAYSTKERNRDDRHKLKKSKNETTITSWS